MIEKLFEVARWRFTITAMRFFSFPVLLLSFAVAGTAPAAAWAQQPDKVSVDPSSGGAFTTQAQRVDKLFGELKREGDPDKAKGIANQIRREWQDSGSATINFLIQQSDKAVEENRNAAALDFLDEAIRLRPDYAEGWNRRATLHFKMGNYRKSMSDINQVLRLEPRHFGALAGMAGIMTQTGRDELALKAWERFLLVYPTERQAQKALGELAEKLTGQRT
nr:tetratricopeptide repeat protein [Shinella sp. AETb1-6]